METISAATHAGVTTPRGALVKPRALAPSGYLVLGSAVSCAPTMRTQAIKATKPAAWQFADVRNHRTRRLWEPSQ